MRELTLGLAVAFLGVIWLTILSKMLVGAVRVLRPTFLPGWFALIVRYVPSWRLFGQTGAIFDLYPVIGDRVEGGEEHFHSTYGLTRRWFHAVINPHSRYRYLFRELMQSSMYYHLSGKPHHPANARAVETLEHVVSYELTRLHPRDRLKRRATLYVIVDRGHFSKEPPKAKLALGPIAP